MLISSPDFETLLQGLGPSSEEIAETFAFLGIEGVRNATRILNPVVRYFQGMAQSHWLSMDVMKEGILRVVARDWTLEVPLPLAVQEFLEAFNQGKFPNLERTISRGA